MQSEWQKIKRGARRHKQRKYQKLSGMLLSQAILPQSVLLLYLFSSIIIQLWPDEVNSYRLHQCGKKKRLPEWQPGCC